MCGICGYIILSEKNNFSSSFKEGLKDRFLSVCEKTMERGRDSAGISLVREDGYVHSIVTTDVNNFLLSVESFFDFEAREESFKIAVVNFRAEPTTEFVSENSRRSIQPFLYSNQTTIINPSLNTWEEVAWTDSYIVAHNGTIANDKEILLRHSDIWNFVLKDAIRVIDSWAIIALAKELPNLSRKSIESLFSKIEGSYAFVLVFPNQSVLLARNYRDLCLRLVQIGDIEVLFFASKPEALQMEIDPLKDNTYRLPAYSYAFISSPLEGEPKVTFGSISFDDGEVGNKDKAVVICSGGLDSTVSATIACKENKEITLMYFLYGCKAESREVRAVKSIFSFLKRKFPDKKLFLEIVNLSYLKELGGSTITDESLYDKIETLDRGVETHNEWVPARNLVMLAFASAFCDRYRIGKIYLGLNMEEAGAYPDNTTEFYELLEKVLQVGTTSRPQIINPLANLVKHEIYRLGMEISAPIHLSWSCYHDGEKHCGKCGPCVMRKTAEMINNVNDCIEYEYEYK